MRTLDEAEKLRLAKLSIFDKINKGDWYQYSKEVELQKIVKNSSQKISEINDKAKENIDEAKNYITSMIGVSKRNEEENSWRIFFQIYLKVQKYIFQ